MLDNDSLNTLYVRKTKILSVLSFNRYKLLDTLQQSRAKANGVKNSQRTRGFIYDG